MTTKKTTGFVASIGYGDAPAKRKNRQPGSLDHAEDLADVAEKLDAIVVDVRAKPGPVNASDVRFDGKRALYARNGQPIRVRYGFWRCELAALLGDRYEWAGNLLGGPGGGAVGPDLAGIDMLAARHKAGARLLLMCAEASPGGCHRHHQIAVAGRFWQDGVNPPPLSRRRPPVDVFHVVNARCADDPPGPSFVVLRASALDAVLAEEADDYSLVSLDDFAAGARP